MPIVLILLVVLAGLAYWKRAELQEAWDRWQEEAMARRTPSADQSVEAAAAPEPVATFDQPLETVAEPDVAYVDEEPEVEYVEVIEYVDAEPAPAAEPAYVEPEPEVEYVEVIEYVDEPAAPAAEPLVRANLAPAEPPALEPDYDAADRFAPREPAVAAAPAEPEPEPEPAVTDSGLVVRARKEKSDEGIGGGPIRGSSPLGFAQTSQRPSVASKRSPDKVRSMLSSYKSGLKQGRERPEDE